MIEKSWIVLGSLLLGCLAYAGSDAEHKGDSEHERFQAMKQEMLKDMDARIGFMQKSRDCVSAAASFDAAKKCHEDEEAATRSYFHAKRKAEIERKKKELEKAEQELDQDERQSKKP